MLKKQPTVKSRTMTHPKKPSKSSAQIVASTDDLLTMILLLLPIKPLTRFKSVSKHWHSLISNPIFLRSIIRNPNPAIGLFLLCDNVHHPGIIRPHSSFEYQPFSSSNVPSFKTLNFNYGHPSGIGILHSCNGLLLCSDIRYSKYYVCNPTTRNIFTLPSLVRRKRSSTTIVGTCLAFDPVKSHHYKVFCVRRLKPVLEYRHHQIEVYSSESGSWSVIGEPFTKFMTTESGVYWNGCVFWINGGLGESFYLNIENQEIKTMPMPEIPDDQEFADYYFGESCDHLHYVHHNDIEINVINVQEMKRDCSEWFVKYRVNLLTIFNADSEMITVRPEWGYHAYFVMYVVRGKEDDESFMVMQIPGKVIRLNFVNGSYEMLPEFEGSEVKLREYYVKGFQYIESLSSV